MEVIKACDRSAAHLEATRLAGFSASEAPFLRPGAEIPAATVRDYLTPWPADVAKARYLERRGRPSGEARSSRFNKVAGRASRE